MEALEQQTSNLILAASMAVLKPDFTQVDRRSDGLTINGQTVSISEHIIVPQSQVQALYADRKISFNRDTFFESQPVFDPGHAFSVELETEPRAFLICPAAGVIYDPISDESITKRSRKYEKYALDLAEKFQQILHDADSFGVTNHLASPPGQDVEPGNLKQLVHEIRYSKQRRVISHIFSLIIAGESEDQVFDILPEQKQVFRYKIEPDQLRKVRLSSAALKLATEAIGNYRK